MRSFLCPVPPQGGFFVSIRDLKQGGTTSLPRPCLGGGFFVGREQQLTVISLRGEKATGFLEKHGVVTQTDGNEHVIGMGTSDKIDTVIGSVIVFFDTVSCQSGVMHVARIEANGSVLQPRAGEKRRTVCLNGKGVGSQRLGKSGKGVELVVKRTVFESK